MEPPNLMTICHQLNITIGRAVHDLELIAKALEPDDLRNNIEFIPL